MCLRRAPEKYITGGMAPVGAALDRAGLDNVEVSTSHNPMGLDGLLQGYIYLFIILILQIGMGLPCGFVFSSHFVHPVKFSSHQIKLQVSGVVGLKNMIISPVGPGTKNDCADEYQQQLTPRTDCSIL
jgi:hypothetical protein